MDQLKPETQDQYLQQLLETYPHLEKEMLWIFFDVPNKTYSFNTQVIFPTIEMAKCQSPKKELWEFYIHNAPYQMDQDKYKAYQELKKELKDLVIDGNISQVVNVFDKLSANGREGESKFDKDFAFKILQKSKGSPEEKKTFLLNYCDLADENVFRFFKELDKQQSTDPKREVLVQFGTLLPLERRRDFFINIATNTNDFENAVEKEITYMVHKNVWSSQEAKIAKQLLTPHLTKVLVGKKELPKVFVTAQCTTEHFIQNGIDFTDDVPPQAIDAFITFIEKGTLPDERLVENYEGLSFLSEFFLAEPLISTLRELEERNPNLVNRDSDIALTSKERKVFIDFCFSLPNDRGLILLKEFPHTKKEMEQLIQNEIGKLILNGEWDKPEVQSKRVSWEPHLEKVPFLNKQLPKALLFAHSKRLFENRKTIGLYPTEIQIALIEYLDKGIITELQSPHFQMLYSLAQEYKLQPLKEALFQQTKERVHKMSQEEKENSKERVHKMSQEEKEILIMLARTNNDKKLQKLLFESLTKKEYESLKSKLNEEELQICKDMETS
jgi:hypothetical protein